MLGNDGSRFAFPVLPTLTPPAAPGRVLVPVTRASSDSPAAPPGSPVRARFAADREAPASARLLVAGALAHWGVAEPPRHDVVLAVSELVSDAVTYPLAVEVEVELAHAGDRVELVVRDSSPEPPLQVDPVSGTGQLARAVLDTCSERWSWSPRPGSGRTVRASFRA